MERGLFVLFVTGTVAAVAIACSSSDSSTFSGTPPQPDADTQPPGTFGNDGGGEGGGDGSATASCDPAIPDMFTPTWKKPVANPTACDAPTIKGYYDACLADPSKTAQCDTFKAANDTCAKCIEASDQSGPIQWHDAPSQPRLFFTINVAGCISIEQGADAGGPDDCATAYNAAVQCSRASCQNCLTTGGTFDQFRACQQDVQTQGVCKSYENVQSQDCQGIKNPGAPTLACFLANGESQDVFFERVETIFCGQP